jgi:hemerythrin-like domain-containing protein
MFKQYERTNGSERKASLVEKICAALKAHTTVEEEIFYPAVRVAIRDDDLMDEADVEHASAKELIAQLEAGEPGDDHYDAKVMVLGEYIRHHVKEEQREMFPKARKAKLDLKELGRRIQARKAELMPAQRSRRPTKGLLQRLSLG